MEVLSKDNTSAQARLQLEEGGQCRCSKLDNKKPNATHRDSQRAVGVELDVVLLAHGKELLLRGVEMGVEGALVDGGQRQLRVDDLLQVLRVEVGDANRLGFAGLPEVDEGLPRVEAALLGAVLRAGLK